jgi:phage portal protein BeeE
MLDARNWNAGEAARMFGIPGPLLEYSRGGSSLTYANVATLMDQFLRQCLIPNYLEPLEQVLSDLLPRNWACRFNVDAILRADIQTRFNVYKTGIESGVIGPEEARSMEGLDPGSVETAPVPFSPPAAYPPSLPNRLFGGEWRCDSCHRKLAEVRGMGTSMKCRCGALAVA